MNLKTNHKDSNGKGDEERFSVSSTAFLRWRSPMLIGICFFGLTLVTIEVEGQSPASVPASAAGVAQPPPVPSTVPATPNNVATTSEQPGDDQDTIFVFKAEVREVILHAIVVDEQRRLVTSLDRPAFTTFEDGVPQATTSFHRDDVPVAMGIVIDNSGSMREKRDKVNQAVFNLIRASNPKDQTFVVNFSQDSYLDQDFTSDIDLLQQALHKVSMQGSTALYDAIVASAIHLKNNTHVDRKVLLVITDGRDNASQETLQEAMRRLQQKDGPTLYAIGLLGDGIQAPDSGALRSLADSTGGVAFFPKGLEEVDDITRTVARDIHSQYTIGYKPTNHNQNGAYRVIEVRAQAPGHRKLTVRTRSGYYGGEAVH
ncbi:MAG: VWA domain-containing protein [Terriglobales bacterium]|jgi:VWFA-related protein